MTLKYLQQTNGRRKKPKVRSSLFCTKSSLSFRSSRSRRSSQHPHKKCKQFGSSSSNNNGQLPRAWDVMPIAIQPVSHSASLPAYYSWHSFVLKSCNMHLCSFISLPRFFAKSCNFEFEMGEIVSLCWPYTFSRFPIVWRLIFASLTWDDAAAAAVQLYNDSWLLSSVAFKCYCGKFYINKTFDALQNSLKA